MYPVSLAGPRLCLREFSVQDVAGIHAIYGDAEATRHLSFEPRSAEEVENLIARVIALAGEEPRAEYSLAAVSCDDDAVVGFARLAVESPHSATIGFATRADSWGKGLGTEIVGLLCTLGFEHLGLHRIWAARAPENAPSDRVLRKAGFTEEGRIRAHVHVHGAWRDSVTYSILRPEWESD
ncbi:GNAT family protein [Longispora sp. NPDC051575]|uniref:GNAT family N-acetyltransferase n=1 Tax=Longispora sp. NPDC051575 TaxID=3154943 RepID=UPI00341C3061